jgi:hypothetical protein
MAISTVRAMAKLKRPIVPGGHEKVGTLITQAGVVYITIGMR